MVSSVIKGFNNHTCECDIARHFLVGDLGGQLDPELFLRQPKAISIHILEVKVSDICWYNNLTRWKDQSTIYILLSKGRSYDASCLHHTGFVNDDMKRRKISSL